MNFHDNSKNKNCKIDFSFVSSHCIKPDQNWGGVCISLGEKKPQHFEDKNDHSMKNLKFDFSFVSEHSTSFMLV